VPHVYIHFLGDGRDTAPTSATTYLRELLDFIAKDATKETSVELATIIGRYYAMDRDKRWERVKLAVDGLVQGKGENIETISVAKDGKGDELVKKVEERYGKGEKDEFLKPIVVEGEGRIKGELGIEWPRRLLSALGLPQTRTQSSSSTTVPTVCARLSRFSELNQSLWR